MHTSNELLDLVKTTHGIQSDYKLAQVLMVAKSAVINYRKGFSHPDQSVCMRIATLLDLDPDVVLCSIQAERTKDEVLSTQWARIADRLKAAASVAACALLSVVFSGSPDAHAQGREPVAGVAPAHISTVHSLYIAAKKAAHQIRATLTSFIGSLSPLPTLQD